MRNLFPLVSLALDAVDGALSTGDRGRWENAVHAFANQTDAIGSDLLRLRKHDPSGPDAFIDESHDIILKAFDVMAAYEVVVDTGDASKLDEAADQLAALTAMIPGYFELAGEVNPGCD